MNSLFFCRYVCRIPVKELQITYSASSGPGGQAINKSSSKVLIKFRPKNCTVLTAEQKDVLHKHGSSSQTGTLIVSSEKTRSQSKNLDDAMNKLERKLKEILEPKLPEPLTPEEIEKLDKGKLKAEKKRLEQKRYRGSIKKERKGIFYE